MSLTARVPSFSGAVWRRCIAITLRSSRPNSSSVFNKNMLNHSVVSTIGAIDKLLALAVLPSCTHDCAVHIALFVPMVAGNVDKGALSC